MTFTCSLARFSTLAALSLSAASQVPADRPIDFSATCGSGMHALTECAGPIAGIAPGSGGDHLAPLTFIENRGQWDQRARFLLREGPLAAWLEDRSLMLSMNRRASDQSAESFAVRLAFEGACQDARPEGEGRLAGKLNYFIGNDRSRWATDVATYASAVYRNLYSGIDVRLREEHGGMEYDVVVAPDADLSQVEIRCEGIDAIEVDSDGGLALATPFGPIHQSAPKTWYQLDSGEQIEIACRCVKLSEHSFGFQIDARDPSLRLVIDPGLEWATYLGGSSDDSLFGVAATNSGQLVVVGRTISADFPTTTGPLQAGNYDAFVARLDPSQTGPAQRVWATFVGGFSIDLFLSVGLDANEDVYAVGDTVSPNFPITAGAFDTTINGAADACLVRLNQNGNSILYSTYLGGNVTDGASRILVSGVGSVAIAGATMSPSFPVTPGALQPVKGANADYFLARLALNGAGAADLVYSTFLGGNDQDGYAPGISSNVFDETIIGLAEGGGDLVLSCMASSTDLPTTANAFQASKNGYADVFLARIRPAGLGAADLIYGTYIGGAYSEGPNAVAVDASGVITLGGFTYSADFPVTPGAFETSFIGPFGYNEGLLLRIDPSLPPANQLVYSTFFTDSGSTTSVWDVKLVRGGRVAGTGFGGSGIATTCGAYDTSPNGAQDGFVFLLDPRGQGVSDLLYLSVVGGIYADGAVNCAVASTSPTVRLLVGASSGSPDHPTTPGAFQPVAPGSGNGCAYRIELAPQVTRYCATSPNSVGAGALIAANGTLSIAANNFSLVASQAPAGKPGLFLYSASQALTPFGNGSLCLGSPIFRLNPPLVTDGTGTVERSIDFNSPPSPAAAIVAGSTWNFQFTYRDPAAGGARFNQSDAFQASFCP